MKVLSELQQYQYHYHYRIYVLLASPFLFFPHVFMSLSQKAFFEQSPPVAMSLVIWPLTL